MADSSYWRNIIALKFVDRNFVTFYKPGIGNSIILEVWSFVTKFMMQQ